MQKPFDLTKFRTSVTKSIAGISAGFHDPKDWISTGNKTLNYLISSDFNKGIPLGKVSVFAGESGSCKSFICSGNITGKQVGSKLYTVKITLNSISKAFYRPGFGKTWCTFNE